MACFIVPAGEAIVTTIVKKQVDTQEIEQPANNGKISWSTKLKWLNNMLWGGALLLALEHIWHGEVVLYPPFLTAMASAADTAEMLHEMATVGVGMAVLVTLAWAVMVMVVDHVPALSARLSGSEA